jgi:hypothetical protein
VCFSLVCFFFSVFFSSSSSSFSFLHPVLIDGICF